LGYFWDTYSSFHCRLLQGIADERAMQVTGQPSGTAKTLRLISRRWSVCVLCEKRLALQLFSDRTESRARTAPFKERSSIANLCFVPFPSVSAEEASRVEMNARVRRP